MRVIGLMSGTSADGVDAALVELQGAPHFFAGDFSSTPLSRILQSCEQSFLLAFSPLKERLIASVRSMWRLGSSLPRLRCVA